MFKLRSTQKEYLDAEDLDTFELYQNLSELNFINTWLGGHQITLKGLKSFLLDKNKTYHVLEIGCGGGDNLLYLAKWAKKHHFNIQFTGVDLKHDCVRYAKNQCKAFNNISFIEADYRELIKEEKQYDIIYSSLFCHHFTNKALKEIILFKIQKSRLGYFINDLQRNPIAYYSIKILTNIFSKSRLVKNDAPLSVLRGFSKKEISEICSNSTIKWQWAFRWLVVYHHG
ncbi:MAG: methyltransferase domain-containing protein [Bacteroidia bacterium]